MEVGHGVTVTIISSKLIKWADGGNIFYGVEFSTFLFVASGFNISWVVNDTGRSSALPANRVKDVMISSIIKTKKSARA